MYRYDEFDAAFVAGRTAQFADQVARRLSGELSEDQFRPLRLMNGLYLQLHAYMLRVAVPYGTLNSRQMRKFAHIARTYDRGYGHFTTRQNIQFNWPKLRDVPEILGELASVEMHAIQTSGNCIRNTTADQFAGAAADEIIDPRPIAEIIRQWSSLHPEFSYLPRKFKIAMTGAPNDRAAIRFHDIGLQAATNGAGDIGWEVWVGGGLGRTPMIAKLINSFVPNEHLLAYLESIMRVYNRYGRRDNKYKARIKILVHEEGLETIKGQVEAEFSEVRGGVLTLPEEEVDRITAYFASPEFKTQTATKIDVAYQSIIDPAYGRWLDNNINSHRQPGYASVTISLKPIGGAPGDATDKQMDDVADIAERYAFDELRVSHEQNLVLPHVAISDLRAVYDGLVATGLAEGNAGLISDIICCPGMDFCALGDGPLDPDRAGNRAQVRGTGAPGGNRRSQDQDFRLHQCLRPPPCRPYRHSRRREEGWRTLPDHARRRRHRERLGRQDHRTRLRGGRSAERHRDAGRYLHCPPDECRRKFHRRLPPSG